MGRAHLILIGALCGLWAGCVDTASPGEPRRDADIPSADADRGDAETDGSVDAEIIPDSELIRPEPPAPRPNELPGNPRSLLEPPCTENPQCPGSRYLDWALEDIQPLSARFGETYGLSVFGPRVIVMGLHAGWCSYCRSQVAQMERMSNELRAEGLDVQFISVNATSALSERDQRGLLYQLDELGEIMLDEEGNPVHRITFPLFQDTRLVNQWDMHRGRKDDFFIYDRDGILTHYLAARGPMTTNLSTDTGYSNLLMAVREALER